MSRFITLLVYLCVFPLHAQEVDLRNAECGITARGSYSCDFEYYLRQSAEPQVNRGDPFQIQVGASGGYSIGGSVEDVPYVIGGSSRGSFWALANSEAARTAAVMQFYAPYLPGVYEHNRAEASRVTYRRSDEAFAKSIARLQAMAAEINLAQGKYHSEVVQPAVKAYQANLKKIALRVESTLETVLSVPSQPAEKQPPVDAQPISGVSPSVRSMLSALPTQKTALQKWETLENVWEAGISGAATLLPAADRSEVSRTYGKYFDANGLASDGLVSSETARISHSLGFQLQTTASSKTGIALRHEINRALVAYDSLKDESLRARALGALSLAMGADQAYAAGARDAARELLRKTTVVLDRVLGVVPIASSVNDAAQILWGMAFGCDYTGQPMVTGDYSLRGLGIVLGILPVKAAVQFGSKVVGSLFRSGANWIRKLELSERFAVVLGKDRAAAKEVAEAVGHYAEEVPGVLDRFRPRYSAEAILESLRKNPELKEQIAKELVEIEQLSGPHFFKGSFLKHYFDHVVNQKELSKLGIHTPKAYLQGAQKLISNPAAESVVRPDGRKMHFLKETSEFAITQGDTIITYFIPDERLGYWIQELTKVKNP
jgi:hypothetical protein